MEIQIDLVCWNCDESLSGTLANGRLRVERCGHCQLRATRVQRMAERLVQAIQEESAEQTNAQPKD